MGKLIDADKVQSWIDVEFEKKFPGDCYGYADGRQTILDKLEMEINNGTFDPDPIPLPTIKPGDKVKVISKPGLGIGIVVDPQEEGLYEFTDRTWLRFEVDEFPMHARTSDLEVSHD